MSTAMWKPVGPMSSSEFQTIDVDRASDIQHKHAAVSQFIESRQFDALLLQRPSNFSWFTSGGDCSRAGSPDASAGLFITPEARVVVTTNAASAQIFDSELQGLGFQLKERPWHEPRGALIEDLCRGIPGQLFISHAPAGGQYPAIMQNYNRNIITPSTHAPG